MHSRLSVSPGRSRDAKKREKRIETLDTPPPARSSSTRRRPELRRISKRDLHDGPAQAGWFALRHESWHGRQSSPRGPRPLARGFELAWPEARIAPEHAATVILRDLARDHLPVPRRPAWASKHPRLDWPAPRRPAGRVVPVRRVGRASGAPRGKSARLLRRPLRGLRPTAAKHERANGVESRIRPPALGDTIELRGGAKRDGHGVAGSPAAADDGGGAPPGRGPLDETLSVHQHRPIPRGGTERPNFAPERPCS